MKNKKKFGGVFGISQQSIRRTLHGERFAIRHLCQKTEKIDKTIEGMRKIIGKIQN